MKCKKHRNQESVAVCAKCGAGVCTECATATEELHDECGTLCISCYINNLSEAIEWFGEKKKKAINNIICNTTAYILGAICAISLWFEGEIIGFLVALCICGLYNGISGWKKAERAHEEYEEKHGASYTVTSDRIYRNDGFFLKAFITILYCLVGVIVTPIIVIKNIFAVKQAKTSIEELSEAIEKVKNI